MQFTKMQANGNDYIYIDLHDQTLSDPVHAAIRLSDRHFGIGGDGLVLLCPSDKADFRMRIFDPDGTEAEMCGNALQSAGALFALSRKPDRNCIKVETRSGIRAVFPSQCADAQMEVSADIGAPDILFENRREAIDGKDFLFTSLSFGNPHCVVFTDDLSDDFFLKYGPLFETHELFPGRTNVEFLSVMDRCHFRMRTWERGCGETLSCATGSAAGLVAAVIAGLAEPEALVMQRGGNIRVFWNLSDRSVRIYGKTQIVFQGIFDETEILMS